MSFLRQYNYLEFKFLKTKEKYINLRFKYIAVDMNIDNQFLYTNFSALANWAIGFR
jgi:hypothetical protein